MTTELIVPLTSAEAAEFKRLEKVINIGLDRHLDAWAALAKIQRERLYRDDFDTFDAYVRSRWGFTKSYAYRLIQASEVRERLSTMGDKIPEVKQITSERQYRELADLPEDALETVIERAAVLASDSGTPITTKTIAEAKRSLAPPAEPDPIRNGKPPTDESDSPAETITRAESIADDEANDIDAGELIDGMLEQLRQMVDDIQAVRGRGMAELLAIKANAITTQLNLAILLLEESKQ